MLGKRSRPIHRTQSKFHLMSSENRDCPGPNKSNGFFNNPRLFVGFNSKIPDGEGGSRSPTSTLDAKVFSDYKPCRSPRGFDNPDSQGVGLAILAALHNDNTIATYGKTTLLSPKNSETGFPVKTLASSVNKKRAGTQPISIGPTRPPSDDRAGMEYSESYTCITSHGPKPSIRQIFNDPVEAEKRNLKCCKPPVFEADKRNLRCSKPAVFEATASSSYYADAPTLPAADFLSVCYLCRRQLRHGKDIYMYRGDKAFCSEECRYQQIVSDEKERCASSSMKRASAAVGTSPQASLCFYPGANIFSTDTMAAA